VYQAINPVNNDYVPHFKNLNCICVIFIINITTM